MALGVGAQEHHGGTQTQPLALGFNPSRTGSNLLGIAGIGKQGELGRGSLRAEPVAVVIAEPQKTCADLDDDADGVNNCNDKCPSSAAGEAIGADGCPVIVPEPQPEADCRYARALKTKSQALRPSRCCRGELDA